MGLKISFLFFLLTSFLNARTLENASTRTAIQTSLYGISNLQYKSNDGEIILNCDFWQIDDSRPNWEVYCGKGTQLKKEFLIHFAIRIQNKNIEIQYWLTDRQIQDKPRFQSANSWIEISDRPQKIRLSLGVENDYASLYLDAKPKQ